MDKDISEPIDEVVTYSSLAGRIFASVVDIFFIFILFFLLSLFFDSFIPRSSMNKNSREFFDLISGLMFFLLPVFYFAIMESSKMQATAGKYITGIKVVDESTFQKISFVRAFFRAIIKIVSIYFFGIGLLFLIILLSNGRGQSVHDGITKTFVIDR
ncbi:MAG TPA: RDD family protein [Pyrinomonadaceae bacterium]|jgi:uncharacterized RDD family membrane protein YckC